MFPGKYFVKEKVEISSSESQDLSLAKELWKQTEDVTKTIDSKLTVAS